MGEFELLARIRERLPAPGPQVRLGSGDDAAVSVPDGATATSVDAVVEGVHFRREEASLSQIGHKALAAALSDLAAMGAKPGEAYVALGLPPDLGEDECLELLDGMTALAATTGTTLAGGDVTRAAELFLAITVVGHADSADQLLTRSGARPGDVLVVTGELGGAAAGLQLADDGRVDPPGVGSTLSSSRMRVRQLEPVPRLGAGRALGAAGATAMIDISDGLGGDALHLAAASGVGLRIDAEAIPLEEGLQEIAAAANRDPLELAIGGGEDYELLASIPRERVGEAQQGVDKAEEGVRLTPIGEATDGTGVEIRLPGGGILAPAGYDQLA